MVKRSFVALLAEINDRYECLRAANAKLEVEVAALGQCSPQQILAHLSSQDRSPSLSASATEGVTNFATASCDSLLPNVGSLSLALGDTHGDELAATMPRDSQNANNRPVPVLHRSRTDEICVTLDKDGKNSLIKLPKLPVFALPEAPPTPRTSTATPTKNVESAPDESEQKAAHHHSSASDASPRQSVGTMAATRTWDTTLPRRTLNEFAERSQEVMNMAQKQEPKKDNLNFGLSWDGDLDRANNSIMSMLRRTRGPILRGAGIGFAQHFDIFSGVVIITYVGFLGVETEVLSRGWRDFNSAFVVLHNIYNAYFFIELIVRLWCVGLREFFTGSGWRLNFLDVILVASAVLDVGMRQESSSSARMLRSIRVVRLVRTVRIVRAMRDVREFQKMVFAITSSLKTLAYSIVILFFILYFFAVIFTYGAMEARESFQVSPPADQDDETVADLERYWGTFFMAIFSCYLSVSAGQSWYYVLKPLADYSTLFTLCFISFIALTLFGVLNAITAIFVESSLMSAQHYKDLIILDKAHEKELALNHIRAVFRQIDTDGSGEISAAELEFFLAHDALRRYMEALNITTEDTRMLFRLLDLDESGVIDFEEFCAGCMRLKGEARAFDVHVMLLQLRHFVDRWSSFTRFVAEQLGVACEPGEPVVAAQSKERAGAYEQFLADAFDSGRHIEAFQRFLSHEPTHAESYAHAKKEDEEDDVDQPVHNRNYLPSARGNKPELRNHGAPSIAAENKGERATSCRNAGLAATPLPMIRTAERMPGDAELPDWQPFDRYDESIA